MPSKHTCLCKMEAKPDCGAVNAYTCDTLFVKKQELALVRSTALGAGACSWTGRTRRALLRCCRPLQADRREHIHIGNCSRRVKEFWRASLGALSSRGKLGQALSTLHFGNCHYHVIADTCCLHMAAWSVSPSMLLPSHFFSPKSIKSRPKYPRPSTTPTTSHTLPQGYGLVLGSDVCYSVKALPALFAAAARLLARRPGAEFWLGYVSRCAQCNICTILPTVLVDMGYLLCCTCLSECRSPLPHTYPKTPHAAHPA